MGDYVNKSAVKVLTVLKQLSLNRTNANNVTQLTYDLKLNLDTVFRALKTLEATGFARETERGWQLGPEAIQMSERFWEELDKQARNSR